MFAATPFSVVARLSNVRRASATVVEALDSDAVMTSETLAESYLRRWYAQFNSSFTAPTTTAS